MARKVGGAGFEPGEGAASNSPSSLVPLEARPLLRLRGLGGDFVFGHGGVVVVVAGIDKVELSLMVVRVLVIPNPGQRPLRGQ